MSWQRKASSSVTCPCVSLMGAEGSSLALEKSTRIRPQLTSSLVIPAGAQVRSTSQFIFGAW